MSRYTSTMFEEIKDALKTSKSKDGGLYLRFEPINTFLVRLLPNFKNPKTSILGYYFHMFNSHVDGTSINFTCPTTYKERCTACNLRFKLYRAGGEIDKSLSKELSRKAKFLVNVYVINDPLNPQNNGKVKVMRYGKQLDKIISSAIDGDDAKEFGQSIFDLSENGCNLRVKVEKSSEKGQDQWPSYVSSKFLNKSKIEGMTEERMEEIYSSTNDLDSLVTATDPEKINKIIKEHFLSDTPGEVTQKVEEKAEEKDKKEEEDNIPMGDSPKESSKDDDTSDDLEENKKETPDEIQKKIDDLLEGVE